MSQPGFDPHLQRPEACVSDLTLDRLLVGELEGSEAGARARTHLETCAACAARLSSLQGDRERFSQEVWVAGESQKVSRRVRGKPWGLMASAAGALAAAAVALLMVWPSDPVGVRSKGSDALGLFVRLPTGKVERALPGAKLSPGDTVRFELTTSRAGYLVVVGVDSSKSVATYLPVDGKPVRVPKGKDQILEGAVELDATLGFERFFAVVCDPPVALPTITSQARQALESAAGRPEAAQLAIPGCSVSSTLIEKVGRP